MVSPNILIHAVPPVVSWMCGSASGDCSTAISQLSSLMCPFDPAKVIISEFGPKCITHARYPLPSDVLVHKDFDWLRVTDGAAQLLGESIVNSRLDTVLSRFRGETDRVVLLYHRFINRVADSTALSVVERATRIMDNVPSYSTASSYLLFPGAFRALGKIGSTTLLDFSSATIAAEKTRINESAMELFATLTRIGDCVRMVDGIIATYYTNPVGQHPDTLLKRLLDSRGVRPEESKYIVQFRRAIQLSESMHVHVNALLATSSAVCEDIAHLREYMAEPKLLGGEQGLDVFLKSISKDMKQSRVQ